MNREREKQKHKSIKKEWEGLKTHNRKINENNNRNGMCENNSDKRIFFRGN